MTATDGPGEPHAFLTQPGQGVNYPRNLWHGVLTPIGEAQDFLIVDRGGDGNNLEEFYLRRALRDPPAGRGLTMTDTSLIDRLFDVIEHDIVPQDGGGRRARQQAVRRGDPAQDRTARWCWPRPTTRSENPLWHGEVHCLKRFYEMPKAERVDTRDCIFLATHEPCSLCLSAITWTGFDNFYYLFSHEDSRDSFAIPHDLKILKEVFTLDPGGYNAENAYWKSFSLRRLVRELPEAERARLEARIAQIAAPL